MIEIAEMAQLNPNILMNCLTKGDHNWRYNDSDSDLDAISAGKVRNTICRTIYGRLFTWIAGKINESLKVRPNQKFADSMATQKKVFCYKTVERISDKTWIIAWEKLWYIGFFRFRSKQSKSFRAIS